MNAVQNPGERATSLAKRLVATAVALALAACSSFDVKRDVRTQAESRPPGPEAAPTRTITNFSHALRCMDSYLVTWGIRDLPVIVEDLVDQTKKVNAGTKDMLISAVSDMTRRSKAIKLITYGKDTGNLISLIESVKGRNAFDQIPPYGIRGSVSQLDDAIVRKNVDGGIAVDPYLSLGGARNAAASVLGVDLTMVSGRDLSVVSGVNSRNSVVIYRESSGLDSDATIRKFGVNFSMNLSRSEGQSQALRNLIELAAIELVGKLGMLPYWRCLGTEVNDESIANEIEDWFQALALKPVELVSYFQYQLRIRGYYAGAPDGQRTIAFDQAVASYRGALGLEATPTLDLAFFKAYLDADHAAVLAKHPAPVAQAAPSTTPADATNMIATPEKQVAPRSYDPIIPAAFATQRDNTSVPPPSGAPLAKPPAAVSNEPLQLAIGIPGRPTVLRRNQAYQLAVLTNQDAFVYCYLRDEGNQVQRIFPNRFDRDAAVRPSHPLMLPGKGAFELRTSPRGAVEAVVCYATRRDVAEGLPKQVTGRDFEKLSVATIDDIKKAFRAATNDQFAEGVFHVRPN